MLPIASEPKLFRIGDKYLIVAGLRGGPPLKLKGNAAIIPTSSFYSLRHLVMAALRAIRSFQHGANISDNFAYELGICLLGIREVSKVIEEISRSSDEFAFISYCDEPMNCLKPLISSLMRGFTLSEVVPSYELKHLPSCTGNYECLAMEQGILIELER
ncbi:MAG: hypothetical protein QXJ48_06855 [Candidatus Korarchaeum sp.]